MMIDIHNHAIPQRVLDLVQRDPVYQVKIKDGKWYSGNIAPFKLDAAWYDPEAKLREMDGRLLDGAIISAAPKPLYFYELDLAPQQLIARETNLGLRDYVKGHEDRLGWMAHVPLAFPEQACQMLREAVDMGATGVEIGTSANGHRLDEDMFEPFWSLCEELDQTVFLHPAYERMVPEYQPWRLEVIVGLPVEVTVTLERMIYSGMLDRHPKLRIVAGLGGGFFPFNAGRLRSYASRDPAFANSPKRDPWSYVGQIKFDSFVDDVGQLGFLLKQAGSANVCIGTDCSFASGAPRPVQDLRAAADNNEAIINEVGENPRKLFRFVGCGCARPFHA
jgi:aminocarboxymuconate-semialdehyde decarboxylase